MPESYEARMREEFDRLWMAKESKRALEIAREADAEVTRLKAALEAREAECGRLRKSAKEAEADFGSLENINAFANPSTANFAREASARLRAALEFYADNGNYGGAPDSVVDNDGGAVARAALETP